MSFLLFWGSVAQTAFILVVFGGGSVAGLWLVRRIVPLDQLKKNHEVAGVTFGVVGAFYGLVIAFVIVAAWERFDQANEQAHAEAVALETLYKIGAAFSEPMRTTVDSAVVEYTKRTIDEEYPEMAREAFRMDREGAHKLWQIVLSYTPRDAKEQILMDKAIEQLNVISSERSLRILYYENDLPSVVWMVIYLGCVITIGFGYFFGGTVFRSQAMMCAVFSILLGMTILAILELAHPYQGAVTISDEPFRYALSRMQALSTYKIAKLPH
ncbi:MAG TPA: DUF4239 domain-containing protein [Candidatus Binataceae bacterium]|nr:DUF4239 domain-containing protein [Candidatus Binataceae bacterium]